MNRHRLGLGICLVAFGTLATACGPTPPAPTDVDAGAMTPVSGNAPGAPTDPRTAGTSGYQPSAAVAYADANWDDGDGLCAQFTSDSLIAGNYPMSVITWVPDLVTMFGNADVAYDEHTEGDDPTANAGDVVVYSDDTGDAFCDDDSDEDNCGHVCIVATGGTGENTITVDCHNNAHYHLPLGDILGGGYSTYRVYHLAAAAGPPPGTVGCSTDYDCNQGQTGTDDVCAASEGYCIKGCHSDSDCPSGLTCEQTQPHWSCE